MVTALVTWTLRRTLRSPLAWVTWVASMAALPALELLSPIGLTTRGQRPEGWLGTVLTATALAGAVFAFEGLSSARGLLDRHRSAERAYAGWTVAGSILIFTVPAAVSASIFLLSAGRLQPVELAGAGLTVAHVTALAWLVALLPIPDSSRSIALLFLAWLLAGWVPTQNLPSAALSALVDVSQASRIDMRAASWSARIALLAPIIVLVGACFSIRPARTHSP